MKNLIWEVDANFAKFGPTWKTGLTDAITELEKSDDRFRKSYRRMVSLQAWKADLLDGLLSTGSIAFFLEAQNDVLISHTHVQIGSIRPALKALRSAIENVVACLYYMDHPVELVLWQDGHHRLPFTELMAYLVHHPRLRAHKPETWGKDLLVREFGTLSRAVHASAASFRMTSSGTYPVLWSRDSAEVGRWVTREQAVIQGLNMLLVGFFADWLQGSALSGLRKAVSLAIPVGRHASLRTEYKVRLFKLPA